MILLRETNENLEGTINLSYTFDTELDRNLYRLSVVEKINLQKSPKKKKQRGKRGEPESDIAMYLLYRYFKRLKIKNFYDLIAILCNNYSVLFYKSPYGAPLSAEMVRKRIQWVKKRNKFVEWAKGFERKYLKEVFR